MKKLIILLASGLLMNNQAHAQIKVPALSPTQTINQEFALSSIELTYSRPSLRGRQMIGDQDPWNVVWRTGANSATKITFGEDVTIMGQKVKAGSYSLYTIPRKDGHWSFILNTDVKNWGLNGYDSTLDLFRVPIEAQSFKDKVETLTMQFSEVTTEHCVLNIRWENFGLKIPISVDIKPVLKKEIEDALAQGQNVYYPAAQYYDQYENNKVKALEMVNKALSATDKPQFWMVYYKAQLQQETGDKAGALASARQSLEMSKAVKAENYIILNNRLIRLLNQ